MEEDQNEALGVLHQYASSLAEARGFPRCEWPARYSVKAGARVFETPAVPPMGKRHFQITLEELADFMLKRQGR